MGRFILIGAVSLLVWFLGVNCGYAKDYTITDEKAVKSILGEAEAESYEGKLAVAYTIINRGSLKGVYGLNAPRVVGNKYSKKSYEESKRAWFYAKSNPNKRWKAKGWGNASDVVIFKKQEWFKKCYIVKTIGNHYFWGVKDV